MLTAVALLTAGCISIALFPLPQPLKEKTLQGTAADKILLIDVSGVIAEKSGKSGAFGSSDDILARVKEELTLAAEDRQIKALLLRINSPGGTVTASDVLYHELTTFKTQRKIPVVAVIMDVGASGGYYVASAADRIVAHPTSVTGSIGVIMLRVNAEGLLQKIGLEAAAIKSGAKKDIGSPFRAMSGEEREIFQTMIHGFQARFLEVVTKSRSGKDHGGKVQGVLTPERLALIADGRVLTGPQAVQAGLIDQTGYLDDGIAAARQLAGIADARVVTYARPDAYTHNIYSLASGASGAVGASGPSTLESLAHLDVMGMVRGGTPQFLYLWMP